MLVRNVHSIVQLSLTSHPTCLPVITVLSGVASVCLDCVYMVLHSFVGTSGENILDIRRFTVVTDSLRILENTLQWGHLAPTAPDTLGNSYK